MSRRRTDNKSPRRADLLERLETAGRALSAATVVFHTALAESQGLSATEEKALDVLDRFGPLTAGELGARTGLAPASITGLINRLERKRFARRIADPADGRRVRVERNLESIARLAPLFAGFKAALDELYRGYSDEELETILHFLTEVARRQKEATERLVRKTARRRS